MMKMKTWICVLLALVMLVSSTAMAGNLGLKPQRPSVASEDADMEAQPTSEEPAGADIDLSTYTDEQLSALANAIYQEMDQRQRPTYGLAIEDGDILIYEDGVRLALFEMSYNEDSEYPSVRCEVLVENNSGRTITISIVDPMIDGVPVRGLGIYGAPDGKTIGDHFYIEGLEDTPAEIFESAQQLTFTFEVYDYDTYETMFEVPVTLG